MEIKNYLFVEKAEGPGFPRIVLPWESEIARLAGNVYGHQEFQDGSPIISSCIEEIDEGVATTKSGDKYTLKDMNSDYMEYMEAAKKGVPIIKNWSLEMRTVMDRVPDSIDEINSIGEHDALMFCGQSSDNKSVYGEITSQCGNYLTLKVSDPHDFPKLTEKEFYVLWPNMDPEVSMSIQLLGEYGTSYEDYEDSFGFKSRPNLSFYIE